MTKSIIFRGKKYTKGPKVLNVALNTFYFAYTKNYKACYFSFITQSLLKPADIITEEYTRVLTNNQITEELEDSLDYTLKEVKANNQITEELEDSLDYTLKEVKANDLIYYKAIDLSNILTNL